MKELWQLCFRYCTVYVKRATPIAVLLVTKYVAGGEALLQYTFKLVHDEYHLVMWMSCYWTWPWQKLLAGLFRESNCVKARGWTCGSMPAPYLSIWALWKWLNVEYMCKTLELVSCSDLFFNTEFVPSRGQNQREVLVCSDVIVIICSNVIVCVQHNLKTRHYVKPNTTNTGLTVL